ncbi:MAG: LytTR family DNA-binding domain-containing protein [Pseudomonadota bacterium]
MTKATHQPIQSHSVYRRSMANREPMNVNPVETLPSRPSNSPVRLAAGLQADVLADRRADKRTIWILAVVFVASFFVEATSVAMEAEAAGAKIIPGEPWVREAASHLVLIALAFLTPFALNRAPLTETTWRWALPLHVGFFLAFSIVHILGFVAIRKLTYPVLFGIEYDFGLLSPRTWIYEMRKDLFTYATMIFAAQVSRSFEQRTLELAVARETAKADKRLSLKCGGRMIFVDAGDIVWAKAAGNYVEIGTGGKTHLARMTLSALETLLVDASSEGNPDHIRIHRSHIVHRPAIEEIMPTGSGEVVVHLKDGSTFPVSRRYRESLQAAVKSVAD